MIADAALQWSCFGQNFLWRIAKAGIAGWANHGHGELTRVWQTQNGRLDTAQLSLEMVNASLPMAGDGANLHTVLTTT